MEQAAAGEVLVTGEVRDALGNHAQLDVAPDASIRAVSRPLAVWRLRCLVTPEASLQPFVAREAELKVSKARSSALPAIALGMPCSCVAKPASAKPACWRR